MILVNHIHIVLIVIPNETPKPEALTYSYLNLQKYYSEHK